MIEKYTLHEVYKQLREDGRHIDDLSQYFRQCSLCDSWVSVDDQSAEWQDQHGNSWHDVCDDCQDKVSSNQQIIDHQDDIPDLTETCDYCGSLLVTDEELDSECCQNCA